MAGRVELGSFATMPGPLWVERRWQLKTTKLPVVFGLVDSSGQLHGELCLDRKMAVKLKASFNKWSLYTKVRVRRFALSAK